MTKTAALSIRITPELKSALEGLAKADKNRSLAAYVEIVLQEHVDEQRKKGRRAKG